MATRLSDPYQRLHDKLHTSDYVWCFTEYKHWDKELIRRLWVLELPAEAVLAYTDSGIWEDIVEERFDGKPEDVAWSQVLVESAEGLRRIEARKDHGIVPLVRVPVAPHYVVDRTRFNCGPNVLAHAKRYENLPKSLEEAARYRV